MASLYLLIPVSLIFCALAVVIFFWAVNSGQYDDLDGEGERLLFSDDSLDGPSSDSLGNPSSDSDHAAVDADAVGEDGSEVEEAVEKEHRSDG